MIILLDLKMSPEVYLYLFSLKGHNSKLIIFCAATIPKGEYANVSLCKDVKFQMSDPVSDRLIGYWISKHLFKVLLPNQSHFVS